jgi:predicted aldo/keto reductase-like oxidoreductase
MENVQQLQENTAVMGMKLALTDADREILARYDRATAGLYCHRCGACTGSCPAGVEIPVINRSLMYAEGYRNLELARATYAGLPKEASAAACGNCSTCTAHCIHGLDVAERMERARMLFA